MQNTTKMQLRNNLKIKLNRSKAKITADEKDVKNLSLPDNNVERLRTRSNFLL